MSAWKKQINADGYVAGTRAAIPLIAEQIDLAHRIIGATVGDVQAVLDLGCGDGALAETVLARHPGASATLVDFSQPMLEHARERFAGDADIRFVHADFSVADWHADIAPAGSFDLVISGYAIHHIDDAGKQRLFREVFALLRHGGLFMNLEHVASHGALGRTLFDDVFIDSVHDQQLLNNPSAQREDAAEAYHAREDQEDNILAPVEEQCRWLREIGFVEVDCYFKLLELALIAGHRPV